MINFYDINVHNICERIIDCTCNSKELLLSEEELFAVASKLLWLEQDHADIRTEVMLKQKHHNEYKKQRAKKGKSVDAMLNRIADKCAVMSATSATA